MCGVRVRCMVPANLTGLTRRMAQKVEIMDGRAIGVRVCHGGKIRLVEAGREVILSGGASPLGWQYQCPDHHDGRKDFSRNARYGLTEAAPHDF